MLEVVHAWQLPVNTGMYAGTPIYPSDAEQPARRVLTAAVDQEDTGGVRVDAHLDRAPASRALLAAAEGADLVVVGSRGLGGFKGLLLGSVRRRLAPPLPLPGGRDVSVDDDRVADVTRRAPAGRRDPVGLRRLPRGPSMRTNGPMGRERS